MADLRLVEAGQSERSGRRRGAILGTLAAGLLVAASGYEMVSGFVNNFHSSKTNCSFGGRQSLEARSGWGVDNLAVRVDGIDTVGPKSICLSAVESYIIARNHLSSFKPDLIVGATYTLPKYVVRANQPK